MSSELPQKVQSDQARHGAQRPEVLPLQPLWQVIPGKKCSRTEGGGGWGVQSFSETSSPSLGRNCHILIPYHPRPPPASNHPVQVKQSLTFHQMQRHSSARPYKCSKCDKRFSRKVLHDSHLSSHGPRTLPCPLTDCTATYSKRSTLHCHIASRHHEYFTKSFKHRTISRSASYKLIQQDNEHFGGYNTGYSFGELLDSSTIFSPRFSDTIEPSQ